MSELTFDIRDIFMAPRYAWSLRKMHAVIRGILSFWLIYLLFTYSTLLLTATGKSIGILQLIRYYELFPLSQMVWGFIGKIPVIGPVLFGIASLPLFLWGLLGIAVFVVCSFSLWLVPVITATDGDDVLETVVQTFAAVFYRPFRLLLYEVTADIVDLRFKQQPAQFSPEAQKEA